MVMLTGAAAAAARMRTAILVNIAMVVENANEQVLPAVYLFVGTSLKATPSQLGTLTLCRALVQTLASPLSGVLGDRCDRRLVLASGAFIWGAMTSAIALSTTLHAAMVFAAFNGLGLALLVPCCQSVVADLHPPEARGRAFGLMQLTGAVGGLAGSVFATNMGASATIAAWGYEGWRMAFHVIACVSLLTGLLVLTLAVDPRRVPLAPIGRAPSYSLLPSRDPSPLPAAHAGDPALAAVGFKETGTGDEAAARGGAVGWPSPPRVRPAAGAGDWAEASPGQHEAQGQYHQSRGLSHSSHQQQQQQHMQQQHGSGHHALSVSPQPGAPAPFGGTTGPTPDPMSDFGAEGSSSCCCAAAAGGKPTSNGVGGGGFFGAARAPRPRRRGLLSDIGWVLRIPTFQAIVLQGIVGCFPWQAAVFVTLWLQLQGFQSSVASLITATFGAGVAIGALMGGFIGDRMARRLPDSGRIFTAQASVASGIPLVWLLLKGVPAHPALATDPRAYAAVLFVLGLTCTWAGSGCNSPIFAEIVPDDMRSLVYAFDRSLESSLAACAAPAVGILAERYFGFTGSVSKDSLADSTLRSRNAEALGSSLLACMALPWTACLGFYTVLHFTYRHDKRAAAAAAAATRWQ